MNFYPRISNSCAGCGEPVTGVYADNEDAAIAGLGLCSKCAGVEPVEVEIDATDAAQELAAEAGVDLADVAAGLEPGARVGQPDVATYLKDREVSDG